MRNTVTLFSPTLSSLAIVPSIVGGGDLSRFINWLTLTHTQRWHQHHRHTVGAGHVYQCRFEFFPVETTEYLLTVCRYMERNQGCARLVERAEQCGDTRISPVACVAEERPTEERNNRTTVRLCAVGGADRHVMEFGRNIASMRATEEGAAKQWFPVSLSVCGSQNQNPTY